MSTLLLDQGIEIPTIHTLEEFRRWSRSEGFPPRGRIDYVSGRIEIDMSPEDVFTHGTLKAEVATAIKRRVDELDLGHTFIAETRVSSAAADLSAEPDVMVISHQSLEQGRVRLVPKATGEPDRYVEVEGGPDLLVEIVSDSSEQKDLQRLPQAYFTAGVRELWLIDARGAELRCRIHHRAADAFAGVIEDAHGDQPSGVLEAGVRLERSRHARGHWTYRLHLKPF
jgi:Uma2 family endonuclease